MDVSAQCSCDGVLCDKKERYCTRGSSGAVWFGDKRQPVLPDSLACLELSDVEKGRLLIQVRALKSRRVPGC